jgi:hypothetical protein
MSLETSYGVNKDRKIYGNCQVVWNGILMFRCEKKRADWYLKTLDKKTGEPIGELINENPYTVSLKFKPRGLGNHDKEFGLTEMSNKCVSCGTEEYLTRHHVVPICYRKFLPVNLKSHNFHDVLALCATCHEKYERSADQLKERLSSEYNAPINGETINNKDLIKYSKIATTLLGDLDKVPKSRVKKMRRIIKKGLNITRLTKSKLQELSVATITTIKRTHGEMVMCKVTDIQSFVEMWREHFVENNECSFLPENWSTKTKIPK